MLYYILYMNKKRTYHLLLELTNYNLFMEDEIYHKQLEIFLKNLWNEISEFISSSFIRKNCYMDNEWLLLSIHIAYGQ